MSLKNKRFWIIGASSGIGAALAQALAKDGAQIALSARRSEKLEVVKDTLEGEGHIVIPVDVSDLSAIKDGLEAIQKEWDGIDSVIYMAATYFATQKERENIDNIEKSININLLGAMRTVDVVKPYFDKKGAGQIVITGSIAGYRGLPNGQPYCATKAALNNYAESLKIELEPHNIDVRLICPGFVETDLTAKNKFDMPMIIKPEEAAEYIVKGLKRDNFEIHFPKQFTLFMKLVDVLPRALYFMLGRTIRDKADN